MWLLHPTPRANGNYTSLRIDYVPLWLHSAPSGCLDLRSTASLWGRMQPSGTIICPSVGVISIIPRRGVQ